ncbi:MAG: 30S ribosomal protein S12 methylthiotransferase RimO [Paludibacteraceae bacterium]
MHKGEIDIITLGCSKNLVDAERLMRRLEAAGWRCVHDAEKPNGEIAVINTCGFIGDAKEESIQTILEFAARKTHKRMKRLYVMGCLSERYLHELEEEIPEVDSWYGKFDFMGLADAIGTAAEAEQAGCLAPYERTLTTPNHYAYLKISEGCNRYCSYCAIPLITGKHTSRPEEEILDEVRWLVGQGVKELNIIAQDLSSYGLDLYGEHRLPQLVEAIAQTQGVEWIRLHYAYPTDFPEQLLDVMARYPNVCKYLDIALQHCSDHMLGLMRRHITRTEQDALIRHIREAVPGICIRTTLLVGHPGETEEDFEELKAWVRLMRFDRMGAFAYSDEEGTYANRHYTDDIPQAVKEQRVAEIMAIQQDISRELQETKVGCVERVIIDREEGDYYVGRTQYDSPEVDCEVLIDKREMLRPGTFYNVEITKAEEFDLYGQVKH